MASNYHGGNKRHAPYNSDNRTTKSLPSNSRNKQIADLPVQKQTTAPYNDQTKRRKIFNRTYVQTPDAWVKYEKITKIGQGTFGEVFKGKNKTTGELVALKRVIMDHEKEGFPITALREIKILQTLNRCPAADKEDGGQTGYHNIVQLLEVCKDCRDYEKDGRPSVFLVFEFCYHDLHGLLVGRWDKKEEFKLAEKKSIVKQMLQGLWYIHMKKIFHRDMKTANVLVTNKGTVKLADFGLARPSYVTSSRQLTNRVVTLWYRPPELLIGDTNYTEKIDLWGCGCIMAELWTKGKPILDGKEEMGQLEKIFHLCGSIDETAWPKAKQLTAQGTTGMKIKGFKKSTRILRERFKDIIDTMGISLLDDLLKLNPDSRPSANSALDNGWFWEPPTPVPPDLTKLSHSQFEFINREQARHKYQQIKPQPKKPQTHNDSMGNANIY